MRYFIYIITILTIFVLSSCSGSGSSSSTDSTTITIKPPVLETITDGDALANAIEDITSNTSFWTQERYDTLRTKINSLCAAGVIESAEAPTENLYVLSVSCLNNRVDEEFKKPRYNNYYQLKSDLAFLKKDNAFLYDMGVTGEKSDPRLEKVEDIFHNYEAVLSLSKSTFGQTPVFMRPYSGDYQPTKSKVESNKYYSIYFSNNSEIIGGVKEFPTRLTTSKRNYYTGLEKLIEEKIVKDKMSETECYQIVADFQKLTKNNNQEAAFERLNKFVTDYIKKLNSSKNEFSSI